MCAWPNMYGENPYSSPPTNAAGHHVVHRRSTRHIETADRREPEPHHEDQCPCRTDREREGSGDQAEQRHERVRSEVDPEG